MVALLQTTAIYKIVVIVHILCAIIGIGTMALNGVYGTMAKKRPTAEGAAIIDANFAVSMIAEKFIYLLFATGIVTVLVSDGAARFESTWVWLSMVLFVAAIGISHGVTIPSARATKELLAELAADASRVAEHGPRLAGLDKRLAASSVALNLIAVVILVLMVFKPGS